MAKRYQTIRLAGETFKIPYVTADELTEEEAALMAFLQRAAFAAQTAKYDGSAPDPRLGKVARWVARKWTELGKSLKEPRRSKVKVTTDDISALADAGVLPRRAANVLVHMLGIEKLSELTTVGRRSLMACPSVSEKTVGAIEQTMAALGLRLAKDQDAGRQWVADKVLRH